MKRKTPRPILRKIIIRVGGRVVKTTRDRLTQRQAVRECGEDHWHSKGAVYSYSRRAGVVGIRFHYEAVADTLIDRAMTFDVNTRDAVDVIRAHFAG